MQIGTMIDIKYRIDINDKYSLVSRDKQHLSDHSLVMISSSSTMAPLTCPAANLSLQQLPSIQQDNISSDISLFGQVNRHLPLLKINKHENFMSSLQIFTSAIPIHIRVELW